MEPSTSGSEQNERVEKLARKLLREDGFDSIEQARAAAEAILEESDERVLDPAAHDHDHPDKIRRTSSETASIGDTGVTRREHDGE